MQTPGVASARVMTPKEQAELLAPWFGPDLPLDLLPVAAAHRDHRDGRGGFDAEGLRFRLAGVSPRARCSTIIHPLAKGPSSRRPGGLSTLGFRDLACD